MQCEMCGAEKNKLYIIEIEGAKLNVCENCKVFGKVEGVIKSEKEKKPKKKVEEKKKQEFRRIATEKEEKIEIIIPNYNTIIKKAREKLGLKQEELAKLIAEKESLIHKIESGKVEPDINVARKIEKFLKVKLVEVISPDEFIPTQQKKGKIDITLGDVVQIKKRKK